MGDIDKKRERNVTFRISSKTLSDLPEYIFEYVLDDLELVDIRQKQIQLIENMLKTTPLQVYTLTIQSTEHTAVMAILPNVIPGSLEFLGLNSKNNGAKLEEIVELEQWKRLKRSYVETVSDSFDIEHFFHLEQFKIVQIRITEERLVKIRDVREFLPH